MRVAHVFWAPLLIFFVFAAGCSSASVPPDVAPKSCQSVESCDDGLYCNGQETCGAGGTCQPGTAPAGDGVACTIDVCDEATDSVRSTPDDAACDDGVYCNGAEHCDDVQGCQTGIAPTLDDGIPCTIDSCDEALDRVSHLADDAQCSDGDDCTSDTCELSMGCIHPVTCPCMMASDCDDNNPCTDDVCSAQSVCGYTNNSADCDDGQYCNGLDQCSGGACTHAGDPCASGPACFDACDELNDSCNAPLYAPCASDADPCSQDLCNSAGACVHPSNRSCTTIRPTRGTVDVPLIIEGSGFGNQQGSSFVTIGGQVAVVRSWSDGYLVVMVPAGLSAGAQTVMIEPLAASAIYTVLPWIRVVDPAYGNHGATLSVRGASFGAAPGTGTIGGVAAVIGSWSDTLVEIQIPSGAPSGPVLLALQIASGPSTNLYTVTVRGNDVWIPIGEAPDPRTNHSAVWTGSEMIIWGGGLGHLLSSGARYDPATDTWIATTTINSPGPIEAHSAVWTGREMIVWGGYNGNNIDVRSNTGGRYDPVTDTWVATSVLNAPGGRTEHSAIWTGNKMIVWGGRNYVQGLPVPYNTGGSYDPTTDSWAPTSANGAPSARAGHAAVWTGSEMIVWGANATGAAGSGGRYDPATDRWIATTTTDAPPRRYGPTAVWTGDRMLVWGGNDGVARFDSGGSYDPIADRWTALSVSGAPIARDRHAAIWSGSQMIIWGGRDVGAARNDGARYDPITDSWSGLASADAPSPRDGHTAVWTGDEMIVWGGNGGWNTGGRYRPASDSWVATSLGDMPQGGETAVWTGSEVIVWSVGNPERGARYNPATDTWIGTSGGTSRRASHTAVWAGDRMLVWGGISDVGSLTLVNTGGQYNPVTDSWTPISTNGAPMARAQHSAVWTGSEMIVWGGGDYGSQYWIGGGRYDPIADSWAPMSVSNEPVGRRFHSAVWSGSQMLVYGGYNSGSYLATGGRYDPATDNWLSLTSGDRRSSHTAVWTGSRMVVWGGVNGPSSVPYVGTYNPVTNTWISASVPDSRSGHRAVWTGSRMIIWGGSYVANYLQDPLNTGGLYDPVTGSWTPISIQGAPSAVGGHTAVWTGSELIVLGNAGSGGRYTP